MKKSLASIFAFVLLLFSVAANAGQIASASVSGFQGDPVTLEVKFTAGAESLSDGGNFRIGFDRAKLELTDIAAPSNFDPVHFPDSANANLENLSLPCNTFPTSCEPAVGPALVFSLLFSISASGPDVIDVTIDWFDALADFDNLGSPLESITPTVTVLERTVPEPGVLGLTGLALLIMTVVGRRHRANCG